jgi:hypothetical protein
LQQQVNTTETYVIISCQDNEGWQNAPLEYWLIYGEYSIDQLMSNLAFVTPMQLAAFYTIMLGKMIAFNIYRVFTKEW